MSSYFDIKLLPDAEISTPVLMNAVYIKLHKLLCDIGSTTIGISFPKYSATLGSVLRLHGTEVDLAALKKQHWLGGMLGYCSLSDVLPVPEGVKHRTIGRKQSNMTESKLNRLLKRGSITEDEAKQYRAKMLSKGLNNPYVELVSASNGHKHRRFMVFGDLLGSPVEGEFDQFGLSKTATVPWF